MMILLLFRFLFLFFSFTVTSAAAASTVPDGQQEEQKATIKPPPPSPPNVPQQDRIKHVVVLMEENRSFDHILGFYKRINSEINGLNGNERIPINPNKSNNNDKNDFMCVTDDAADHCVDDPCHAFECTTRQIGNTSQMNGFLYDATVTKTSKKNRISMWKPENVPVLVKLVQEFALFDHFFASHPGPTYPNRQFVHR